MINFWLGIVGAVLILVAFVLDEFVKSFRQDSVGYNVVNIIGSALLLYYAITIMGWPFIILNAVWLIAAVVKLVQILRR